MDAPEELRRCPDDGRCWHDCAPTDCFRVVGGCVPLSDYGTDWKPEDIARFSCVMDAPDELRQAVIESIRQADYECEMAESVQMPFASWTEHQADAVLAVPAIADALRAAERDAKVAGWVADAIEGDLDLTAPALGRAVAVVHVAEIPPPVPRIAYTFRTRVGGAVCPGCERVVGVGDDAIQWTDDAITHKFCPRPPIVEFEEQR